MTKEEKRRKRTNKLVAEGMKRYRANHGRKKFGADLDGELYEEITSYLKELGITKKDFIVQSYRKLREKSNF